MLLARVASGETSARVGIRVTSPRFTLIRIITFPTVVEILLHVTVLLASPRRDLVEGLRLQLRVSG